MNRNKKNKNKIKKKLLNGNYPDAEKWIEKKESNFDILYAIYPEFKRKSSIAGKVLPKNELLVYDLIAELLLSDKLKQEKGQKNLLKVD